jgi:hypothetical protein
MVAEFVEVGVKDGVSVMVGLDVGLGVWVSVGDDVEVSVLDCV